MSAPGGSNEVLGRPVPLYQVRAADKENFASISLLGLPLLKNAQEAAQPIVPERPPKEPQQFSNDPFADMSRRVQGKDNGLASDSASWN